MKKYSNPTHKMLVVEFEDGDAQFLMRGQSFTTNKAVKRVQAGIVVKDEKQPAPVAPAAPKKNEAEKETK